uniref:Uncharacterized protein n=1 Tax=Rhizophora mucronata TaxID=61149 RepID=A0A2P2P5Y7_RHIMU
MSLFIKMQNPTSLPFLNHLMMVTRNFIPFLAILLHLPLLIASCTSVVLVCLH